MKKVVSILAVVMLILGFVFYYSPVNVARTKTPNKAPEPTPTSVTPRATEGTSK